MKIQFTKHTYLKSNERETEEDMQKVVTLIDISKIDIINRRKEKGRWIKIK
jgi:hypothetical protein